MATVVGLAVGTVVVGSCCYKFEKCQHQNYSALSVAQVILRGILTLPEGDPVGSAVVGTAVVVVAVGNDVVGGDVVGGR